MASLPEGFEILPIPVTPEASKTIRHIEAAAAKEHSISYLMWPAHLAKVRESDAEEPSAQTHEEEELQRDLEQLADPLNAYWMVKQGETIVAYAWWQSLAGRSPEQWAAAYASRYRPPELNGPLADATGGRRLLKRAELLGDRDTLYLKELYVLPEYQRRGIGGTLVAKGAEVADERGVLAYTEATPAGLDLYKRHGFEEVARISEDLEKWGGKPGQVHSYALMLRRPTGQSLNA